MPLRSEVAPNAASPTIYTSSLMRNRLLGRSDQPHRLFDYSGHLNKHVVGVNRAPLLQIAWFHNLLTLSWPRVLSLAALSYLCINLVMALVYALVAYTCGAEVDFITALYFNAVTLAANGGYMGEDSKMMTPGTRCFEHRTYIVLFESYLNIAIAGLIAATLVGKATSHRDTRHYIVFSTYCLASNYDYGAIFETVDTPSPAPPAAAADAPHDKSAPEGAPSRRPGFSKFEMSAQRSHLAFRVGSIHSYPVIDGKLRVFLVAQARRYGNVSNASFQDNRGGYQQQGGAEPASPSSVRVPTGKVITRTTKLNFHCLEENHNDASSSELLLWTPCTIVVPLSSNPILAKAICEANEKGSTTGSGAFGDDRMKGFTRKKSVLNRTASSVTPDPDPEHATPQVQIVAVLQGVDSVTGSVIEATHCYTLNEILRHYHFGFNMLDCQLGEDDDSGLAPLTSSTAVGGPKNSLVVDFHHFNEVHSDF